jgi:hypothetical protein
MPDEKSPPTFPLYDSQQDVESFEDFERNLQGKNHRILKRNPATREVGEGEIIFSIVGGVRKLHVKLDGILVSAVLT